MTGGKTEEAWIQLNEAPIDVSLAEEITIRTDGAEAAELLRVDFVTDQGRVDTLSGTYTEISECARNEKDIFYVKTYAEDGAQYSYQNEIWQYEADKEENTLLYETTEAVWLNEFCANNTHLYWVEYVYEEGAADFEYRVTQYDLTTGEAVCIADRNAADSEEICLAVSDRYLTWYDSARNGESRIAVYDVGKQEMQPVEFSDAGKLMPYGRLTVTEDSITFFSQDEEKRLFINRYHLDTQKAEVLFLGKASDFAKPAACFSGGDYIGWLTEYSYGTYYFYNITDGKLYSLKQSDGMRVFSSVLSDYLYLNESDSGCVLLYDFDTKETYCQKITQGQGLSLRSYGERLLYMRVVGEESVALLTVQPPEERR